MHIFRPGVLVAPQRGPCGLVLAPISAARLQVGDRRGGRGPCLLGGSIVELESEDARGKFQLRRHKGPGAQPCLPGNAGIPLPRSEGAGEFLPADVAQS